jgi:hypothetical protein
MSTTARRVSRHERCWVWGLAVVVWLFFISAQAKPAAANAEQGTSKSKTLPEVTIRAQREALERQLRDYFKSTIREPFDESLVRWTRPICSLVVGLSREEGEFVRARLSQIAVAAGAPLAPRPCRPILPLS